MGKRGFLPGFVMAMLLAGTTASPETVAETSLAEPVQAGAMDAFWSRLDETWNRGDARGLSELFAKHGSFHFVDREQILVGRADILAYFEALFPTVAPEVSHHTTVRKVRAVAPEIQVVDATVEVLRASGDESEAPSVLRNFAVFGVLKKNGEGWHIKTLSAHALPVAAGER